MRLNELIEEATKAIVPYSYEANQGTTGSSGFKQQSSARARRGFNININPSIAKTAAGVGLVGAGAAGVGYGVYQAGTTPEGEFSPDEIARKVAVKAAEAEPLTTLKSTAPVYLKDQIHSTINGIKQSIPEAPEIKTPDVPEVNIPSPSEVAQPYATQLASQYPYETLKGVAGSYVDNISDKIKDAYEFIQDKFD